MLRLGAGLWGTHRLKRDSLPLDDPEWVYDLRTCSAMARASGRCSPAGQSPAGRRYLCGNDQALRDPSRCGFEWSDEQRQTILRHELGHIKRRDNLTNVFSLTVCAFYWFNPLFWWAAARLRICRESACDDLVLNCGTKPSRYVSYLLEATPTPRSRLISVTLSQISVLKKRVIDDS